MDIYCAFWNAINILITKPHVINKRLWGYNKLVECKCKPLQKFWEEKLASFKIIDGKTDTVLEELTNKVPILLNEDENVELILVQLLPKIYSENRAYQLICIKKFENSVTFYDASPENHNQKLCPNFPYTFSLVESEINLKVHNNIDIKSKSVLWLEETVLPHIKKWFNEENSGARQMSSESLSLVSKGKYYEKYNNLKIKYGVDMVKMWPESTDPLKFVYEDIAIASYLLLLWENVDNPQKFVDIGCGNGLLVYILSKEGHSGYGVDVRKRKIWDMYPKSVILKEHTINPTNMDLFLNADWIIGNHSDELTPWIPVIAAKSSYRCNFFLLPCCAFNFDGTKYQRKNTSLSQYNDYLLYVKEVCENLGFQIKLDRLKIPSTKRICYVSYTRSYQKHEYNQQLNFLQTFINQELGKTSNVGTVEIEIKLRESTEKVRNCTQLDKTVTNVIITLITDYLLKDIDEKSEWSAGRTAKLNELIKLVPKDQLKILKSECGGLQTLLKNNHYIFEVKKGNVKLRYPRTIEEAQSKLNKNKLNFVKMQVNKCWFYNNHPQGCPLLSNICSYLHKKT